MSQSRYPLSGILAGVIESRDAQDLRVSRLLHDEVGQILTAVGLQLDVLRMDVEGTQPDIAERIQQCQKHLEQAIEQVRRLNYELNPSVVERAGLVAALSRLVGRFRDSETNVRLVEEGWIELPVEPAKAMYKIAEIALGNALQHAGASEVELSVEQSDAGVTMEIRDDGQGFDPEAAEPGLGLPLMEYYAGGAGLDFSIESEAGRGTIVRTVRAGK